jgi:uncharacterized protein (DUF169 family)
MVDYAAFVDEVGKLIRPQSHILGVKLLAHADQLPEKVARPKKYGIRISLCQWTTMARRWGRPVAAVAEDINCTPCLAALGLKRMEDVAALARYFLDMGYFDDFETALRVAQKLDPVPPGEIRGVVSFPLESAPVAPDVVIIYGSPAQMSRLVAGYMYHSGEPVVSATGFGLSCLAAIKPFFTKKPALVIPGRGERILAGTDDAEMLFSFPAERCAALLEGLRFTQAKGTRYPVQTYMLYEPPLIGPMATLESELTEP